MYNIKLDISLLMFYWNPSLTIGTGGNGYYIFCGPTKPGERRKPKDDIDACCQRHDKCYDKLDVSLFGLWKSLTDDKLSPLL